ncbi:MAG: DUF1926 domain-containing protein [Treponema sp.]|nr:DUF1926 domain-containing protein [Treponema sp.]
MDAISLCFYLESTPADTLLSDNEKDYQEVYKHAAKFLYSHPDFCISFSFTGTQLQFFRKKHPEFLEMLQQLVSRKQVEVLGGGFYNPVFPLLYSKDRTDQIELLSTEIRQSIGKRSYGMTLCADGWDASLVASFKTCGMEYVLLDSSLIPPSKLSYIPVIMSDRGKSISIVPLYAKHTPSDEIPPEEYILSLLSAVKKNARGDKYDAETGERIVCVRLNHDKFRTLLLSGYFLQLLNSIKEKFDSSIHLSYPIAYLKNMSARVPAFISAGLGAEIAQWAKVPYTVISKNDGYAVTIYDFLQTYLQSHALYSRMLYVSTLINQYHGDKARKKAAREKLWASQSGEGFVCTTKGALVNSIYRQRAYRNLNEAEKIIRECGVFKESAARFDYNGDGIDEYMFRMDSFTACVTKKSGELCELDVIAGAGNYADSLGRIELFDGATDNYQRGLFIDHLFSDAALKNYMQGKPVESGIFPEILYNEQRFSMQRKEVQLMAKAEFSDKKQLVSLRKKYTANSNGFTIQYILKNESAESLIANFAVESNFSQVNYGLSEFVPYRVAIATGNELREVDTTKSSAAIATEECITAVSAIQLSDFENAFSFVFTPNENCGFCFVPITFYRPEYLGEKIIPVAMSFSSAMFWKVHLEPGMEMEKTINFSIINTKRKRTKPKKQAK